MWKKRKPPIKEVLKTIEIQTYLRIYKTNPWSLKRSKMLNNVGITFFGILNKHL